MLTSQKTLELKAKNKLNLNKMSQREKKQKRYDAKCSVCCEKKKPRREHKNK